jgi:selenocysteine lyase/cysteine desulfurase
LSLLPSEETRGLWHHTGPYLDTASYGLPPEPAWEAFQRAAAGWRSGEPWEPWNDSVDRARTSFATLARVPVERVATGASAAELMGLVAAALPRRSRVVAYERDFTSLLFPFLANGHELVTVPLDRIADAVDDGTAAVAVSAVQSSSGAVADLDAIEAAARAHGALVLLDATHAIGWLPLEGARYDAVVAAGYKWLLSPRGTAYLGVSDRLFEQLVPLHANWFAADDRETGSYGPPLRLAREARRFDTSPAWLMWIAAEESLRVLVGLGLERIHAHDLALANRFRAGLGLEPGNSAIVSVELPGAAEKLERAGIRAATRAEFLRTSFHCSTTESDVDAALEALSA